MIRKMLLFSLFATAPALACGQEAKLVNCRSLEAAGNFVGSEEVVVDDLVCQKVKSGTATAAAPARPQTPKPLPGAVISDEEPASVVDAAKASTKRVAAAVEANAEKATAATGAAAPAPRPPSDAAPQTEALKPAPAPEFTNPGDEPMSVAEAARANAKRMAEAEAETEKPAGAPAVSSSPSPTPASKIPFTADARAKPQPAVAKQAPLSEPAIAPATVPAESAVMKAAPAPAAPLPSAKGPAGAKPQPAVAKQAPLSEPAIAPVTVPAESAVMKAAPAPAAPLPSAKGPASAKPQPAVAKQAPLSEPAIAPATVPAESAVMKAAPAPAAPLPSAKGPAPVEATHVPAGSAPPMPESTAAPSTEIVIMSAPSREAPAPEPASTPQNEIVLSSSPGGASEAAAPAPETLPQPAEQPDAASRPPASTEVSKQPGATAPPAAAEAPVSAFYDANAPKNSSNRREVTVGLVTAPAGAVGSPADESAANPNAPANSPNGATEAAPPAADAASAAQPDAQPIWPGNAEPNMERERVVETGTFARPKEVADPNQPPHSKQIAPSADDGFQEGQRADCRKNITIGGLKGEKLVLGTPKWAAGWIEKNQKHMLDVCFSDTPMPGARNYLIVFYTSAPASSASDAANARSLAVLAPQSTSPAGGVGTFTTSYGSTWHHFVDRNVGVTVNSSLDADQPQSQPDKVSYATAYTEEGVPVAQHWQGAPKKQIKLNPDDPNVRKESKKEHHAREEMEHVADALLSQMVEEIEKL